MITILVTGGNGQLASCIKYVEKQYDDLNVIYTDYLELDICDLKQVQVFFKANKQIDYCINCAAYTAVDKAETEIDKAFEINATGAKNLALACNEFGVVLIHISTDFVFDGEKVEPYIETDVTNPISVYGASKLQGEVGAQQVLKEYFIIRTSWLYSEYGQNFMKTMLRLAETRDEISIVSDQIGTPTYAVDLAEVIVHIIVVKSKEYGIYHYSNIGETSWYDFAKTIFEETKTKIKVNPIKTEEYPTLADRPIYSVLSKSKIERTFNIAIPDWIDSLKKALKKV
ncbi:dTDP-4-dehydrorhamnose reductase [Yeosuana marina]|uniref:dTDP-4-dehydrorhamnose reductase n=1 Tax=Yeosuana marina TaxID=1565536 RepID=UPI0030EF62CD|tara:strand:+ start:514 stop:1368 length:855 start_codon:yes stop_codon:yes gene_type:complete